MSKTFKPVKVTRKFDFFVYNRRKSQTYPPKEGKYLGIVWNKLGVSYMTVKWDGRKFEGCCKDTDVLAYCPSLHEEE